MRNYQKIFKEIEEAEDATSMRDSKRAIKWRNLLMLFVHLKKKLIQPTSKSLKERKKWADKILTPQ